MPGIRWTQEELEAYLASKNRPAVPATDVEQVSKHASAPTNASREVHPRYRIHVHHRSRRLADATGRSHKAAVDGIVRGGLLSDDSPEWVEEIRETFEKSRDEETIIDVMEIVR